MFIVFSTLGSCVSAIVVLAANGQMGASHQFDVAERLVHSTNIARQKLMLDLCVALEKGKMFSGNSRIVRAVIPFLKHDDSITRSLAISVLLTIGKEAEPAIPALIEVLHDQTPCIGLQAVLVLRKLGEPAVQPLVDSLKTEDRFASKLAVTALAGMGCKASPALPALRNARRLAQDDISKSFLDDAIRKIAGK